MVLSFYQKRLLFWTPFENENSRKLKAGGDRFLNSKCYLMRLKPQG